jgi:hypothetical protein
VTSSSWATLSAVKLPPRAASSAASSLAFWLFRSASTAACDSPAAISLS